MPGFLSLRFQRSTAASESHYNQYLGKSSVVASTLLVAPYHPQLIQPRRETLAHHLPSHAPVRCGGYAAGPEGVAAPLGVDCIKQPNDALRGSRLILGE
jgi:hypothetical protein